MKRNMADQVHQAYRDNLYSGESADNHLLKCKEGSDDPATCLDRFAEIYFDGAYYGVSPAPTIGSNITEITTFVPTSVSDFADKLADKIVGQVSFDSREDGFTNFETVLLETCRYLNTLSATSTDHPQVPTQNFRELMVETGKLPDDFKSKYATIDTSTFRPYFAWKHIDEMYPENERREYYLIERMHILTKYVFILYILQPSERQDRFVYLEQVMTSLVKESLALTDIGNPDVFSLDDTTAENVKLSSKVRKRSELLLQNKGVVQSAHDNLRSLVDVDNHVQRTRAVAWYAMMLLLVLLALSVAGMSFSYARGRTGEVYLVAGVLVLGVLAFEAFKGAERLFSLPSSVV